MASNQDSSISGTETGNHKELYRTHAGSDFKLILKNGIKLKVHKRILTGVHFFRESFANSDRIDMQLEYDEPHAVRALVKHLYGFTLREIIGKDYAVKDLVDIHAIALKYDTQVLTVETTSRLCADLDESFSDGLIFSGYGKRTSKAWIWELAQWLYAGDAGGAGNACPLLREALVEAMHVHGQQVRLAEREEVRAGLRAHPLFAADVLLRGWYGNAS